MRIAVALLALLAASRLSAQITFTPGHFYTTANWNNGSSSTITEWDQRGNLLGTLVLPPQVADDVRGMAFGQDGLLYVVGAPSFTNWYVYAIDSTGTVVSLYPLNVYITGNLSFGKIAVGSGFIFVAGQDVLTRYVIGNPASATTIYNGNQVFGVKMLPNGNLVVAQAYGVQEITTDGAVVRNFTTSTFLVDVRGIAYYAPEDKLYISMLGYTGFFDQVMRFNYTKGVMETSVSSWYADDLVVSEVGSLIVGSRTQCPRLMNRQMAIKYFFGNDPQMFIAQCPSNPVYLGTLTESDGVHVRWHDPALRTWRIEYTDNVATNFWQALASLAHSDAFGIVDVVDSTASFSSTRVYRVVPPIAPGGRPAAVVKSISAAASSHAPLRRHPLSSAQR